MGILRKSTTRQAEQNNTTRGFNIGSPEAEAEKLNIDAFFEDYMNVIDEIKSGKFIITGRKGTGKTAVARYLSGCKDDETMCVIVDPNEIKFQNILQALPEIDSSVYFEWVILVRIVKLILDSEKSNYGKFVSDLRKFYDRNTGVINISGYKITEINKHTEVSFEVLRNSFPNSIAKFYRNRKEIKGHFYEFVPALREIVATVLKYQALEDIDFIVCFDDLDVKFKVDRDGEQLLDLIRVAKKYNTEYFEGTNCNVLVFMRDDIQRHLEGTAADLTKIFGSYEYRIKWYNHNDARINENSTNIKKFINKRISYNFKSRNIEFNKEDPWLSLFEKCHSETNFKGSFRYILDHTFYRPRDIINVLKDIGQMNIGYPISYSNILILLNKYSEYCVGELKDELSMLMEQDDIIQIFEMLKYWAKNCPKPKHGQVVDLFFQYNIDIKYFAVLREYDIIIPMNNEAELFCNYREKQLESDITDYDFTLHKSIYIYFNKYRVQ